MNMLLGLSIALAFGMAPDPSASLFVIEEARTVIALEGGPIVIQVTWRYEGKEPAVLYDLRLQGDAVGVKVPKTWQRQTLGDVLPGQRRFLNVQPGHRGSCTYYLHHGYKTIPTGKSELELVWWPKVTVGKGEAFVPNVRKKIVVDVEPATKEMITSARLHLEDKMSKRDLSEEEERYICEVIRETRHDDIASAGLLLLRYPERRDPYWHNRMREHLYERSKESREFRDRLIEHLAAHGTRGDKRFFDSWRNDNAEIGGENVRLLMGCRDVWVRAYTLDLFPDLCEEGARKKLRDDLAELKKLTGGLKDR